MKLRIIEIIKNPGSDHNNYFIIERKRFFWWRQIEVIDIHKSTKEYKSYEYAEKDIYENYMNKWGRCIKNGNVYTWDPFSYWV